MKRTIFKNASVTAIVFFSFTLFIHAGCTSNASAPKAAAPTNTAEKADTLAAAEPAATTGSTTATAGIQEITGIDVSHYSGSVGWTKVKAAGSTFGIVKATEGMDDKDPTFDSHWPALKAAGLVRGAYHFYITHDDPEKQAAFFTSTVTLEKGDLAPIVDIESLAKNTEPGLATRLQTFLDILEKHYGIKPIIYTDKSFWNANLKTGFDTYPLWLAEYGVDTPNLPGSWKTYYLWQYKGDVTTPGVEKTADLSKLNPAYSLSDLLLK
ncbi:MAG: hypothetical protein GY765_38255 [bacterium]|nr:hypothetical protein [bacterium]